MDVKLHTKLKHQIIGYYFGIFKSVFKSPNMHSLYYVDLFSGDGCCSCSRIDKDIENYLLERYYREWDPPYFRLMEYARDSDFKLKCIFNDLDMDKIELLKKKGGAKGYSDYIIKSEHKQADVFYKECLAEIERPNRPSLFFLDPTNHRDLSFSTIKGISEFKDGKTGRMPELIINLMVYSMLKHLQSGNFETISKALGSDSWLDKKDEYLRRGKTYLLFLNVFLKNLKNLGYYTTFYQINSTKTNSPIYYLIFTTFDEKIYRIHKGMKSSIDRLKEEEWIKRNYEVDSMIDARSQGNRFLSEYI
jgi:three-Cys-motif partner protein